MWGGLTGDPPCPPRFRHVYRAIRVLFSHDKVSEIINSNTKRLILLVLIFACGVLLGAVYTSVLNPSGAHPGKQVFLSRNAPEPIGPYSQAVQSGNLVFLSGQIGIDPVSGNLTGTVEDQTLRAMENQREVLTSAGLTFSDVVQSRIYLTNLSDWTTVNRVYGSYFNDTFPARATVQVAGLPKGAAIEIEMVALKR